MKQANSIIALFLFVLCFSTNAQSNTSYWHSVNTPSDYIHFIEDVNDTTYGITIVGNTVEVRRKSFNTWIPVKPITLGPNEKYKQLINYQNELYALTSGRLLKFSGSNWVTMLTQNYLEKMIVFRSRLLLYGGFNVFQGNTAYGFVFYDGFLFGVLKSPNNLLMGFTGVMNDWLVFNNKLYLGGDIFNTASIQVPSDLLVWNDTTLVEAYTATDPNPIVYDIHSLNGDLYIISHKTFLNRVARLNNSTLVYMDSFAQSQVSFSNNGWSRLSNYKNQLVMEGRVQDTTSFWPYYTTITFNGIDWESIGDSIFDNYIYYSRYINSGGILYSNGKINLQSVDVHYLDTNLTSLHYSVTDALPDSCHLKDARYFLSKKIKTNTGFSIINSSLNGVSTIQVPSGNWPGLSLSVSQKEMGDYEPLACSDSIISPVMNSSGVYEAHFFVKPITPVYDVKTTVSGETGWRARQGFDQNYYISVSNQGTEPLTNVTTNFSFSANSTFVNSSVVPTNAQSTSLSFLIDSLNVGQQKTIRVKLTNGLGYILGDSAHFTAHCSIPQADADTSNNTFTLNQLVVAAVDPNSKLVDKESVTNWGGKMNYLINFQNFGNDTAYTVVVADTLSQALLIESFEFIASSHPVEYELRDNLLVFRFNNILLVDSASNADASKGFVQFTIDMKTQLANTDTIKNRAHIYFDFQPAVITNYAKTFRVSQIGLPEITKTDFKIYPNPSSGTLTISTKNPGIFALYNAMGQQVWRGKINLEP